MKMEIIQPFIDATIKVIETMAFITPRADKPCVWNDGLAVGEVVGIVGLSNEDENVKGALLVGFNESSIIRIASNMLGEEFSTLSEEVREVVGEITNMVSGQARKMLSDSAIIKLQGSIPSVIAGKDIIIKNFIKEASVMVKFIIDSGQFEIGLSMEGISICD